MVYGMSLGAAADDEEEDDTKGDSNVRIVKAGKRVSFISDCNGKNKIDSITNKRISLSTPLMTLGLSEH